jgi:hypothetical protein
MTAAADESRAYLARALTTCREVFFPRAAGRVDDQTLAAHFQPIIAALVVSAAVEALRNEVAE